MKTLLLSGALLLALAGPANAAEVARAGDATLDVADHARDLCVRVTVGSHGYSSRSCGPVPLRASSAVAVTMADERSSFAGGAAPATAARVEAELDDGTRVAADTVAGERYRGRQAGRLRFFLLALPGPDAAEHVAVVRLFGPGGELIGAVQEEYRDDLYAGPTEQLLAQRRPGRAIVLTGYAERAFRPTPLVLDRFETQPCIRVRSRSGNGGSEGGTCLDIGPFRAPLDLSVEQGCGSLRSVLYGFVGPGVTGVRVRLGSGRTRTFATRTLAAFPGPRYVAAVVPRGEAIRSASAIGAEAELELGEPPGGLPCVPSSGGFAIALGGFGDSAPRPAGDPVATETGGHRLLVRDEVNDRLCVGVDTLNADASDCGLPPADPGFLSFDVRGRHFGGVLPGDVARLRLPGGREIATVAGAGYTGRYAGAVRFVLGRVPSKPGITALLAADGSRIGRAYVSTGRRPASRSVALLRGKHWTLRAHRIGEVRCIGFTRYECLTDGDFGVTVTATCSPRRALLYGTLGKVDRVTALLKDGRALRARVIRIPPRRGRGRVYVLPLPRHAEVVALRLDRRRVPFPVLPVARQCGYRLDQPVL